MQLLSDPAMPFWDALESVEISLLELFSNGDGKFSMSCHCWREPSVVRAVAELFCHVSISEVSVKGGVGDSSIRLSVSCPREFGPGGSGHEGM